VIYVYWKDLYPQHTVQFAAAGVFLLLFTLILLLFNSKNDSRYLNFPCMSCCCERYNSPLAVASTDFVVLFKKRSMFPLFGITLLHFLNNH
jgi:hypothetical protein